MLKGHEIKPKYPKARKCSKRDKIVLSQYKQNRHIDPSRCFTIGVSFWSLAKIINHYVIRSPWVFSLLKHKILIHNARSPGRVGTSAPSIHMQKSPLEISQIRLQRDLLIPTLGWKYSTCLRAMLKESLATFLKFSSHSSVVDSTSTSF